MGAVVAVPTSLSRAQLSYAIPTTREGAFWATPGPVVLRNGTVLMTSGNGESVNGRYDGSDSVVHLTADLRTLISRFATPALHTGRAYIGTQLGLVAVNVR